MNTSSPKCRFTKFLSQFDFACDMRERGTKAVRWHGKVGYVDLGENACAVARIELTDLGYQGHYNRFNVQVIHRVNGKLDSIDFDFNDFMTKEDRDDKRLHDHPDGAFYAWTSSRRDEPIDWYIATPRKAAVERFVRAVNEYFAMWAGK